MQPFQCQKAAYILVCQGNFPRYAPWRLVQHKPESALLSSSLSPSGCDLKKNNHTKHDLLSLIQIPVDLVNECEFGIMASNS